jgi:hypothetical protein
MESSQSTSQQQKLPAGATKVPPKDTRFKTDDVANKKGYTFQSFGLSKEV